ncbi:MAG TPA: ChbG/HpnK family deacetylase [Thermoanaerobaculia bacterium]
MRALVVTADDVGLHPGLTAGALKAHDEGIVTACSVVANGRALDGAIGRLRDRPRLDTGIHLTLVGERPLSPPQRVPSLLGRDGAFLPGFRAFAARYVLGGIDRQEIEEELRRQIETLLAAGLRLVHANSHQHLHVLPRIFEIVVRLAEEYEIPYVRIPRDPAAHLSPRGLEIGILNRIGRRARQRLEGSAVRTTDRTVGILEAGNLTRERLARILEDVDGTTELVCHPGIGDDDLAAAYGWGYGWEKETAALCDPGLRKALQEGGIELTSFSRL